MGETFSRYLRSPKNQCRRIARGRRQHNVSAIATKARRGRGVSLFAGVDTKAPLFGVPIVAALFVPLYLHLCGGSASPHTYTGFGSLMVIGDVTMPVFQKSFRDRPSTCSIHRTFPTSTLNCLQKGWEVSVKQ
ncbi:hypothetical protein NPIL_11681 [Nephila pilipes]|uniref:Uncharacterized protein n=1 Tax=Nephila pilipes TaxID=299642 RepID=A0A8X6MWD2_NEPPI|nr:hypothetical protein NPIL_11681 [Nephila pilipes]